MPYFLVMIHGAGIEVPNETGGAPIVGFYANRLVNAATPSDAESKAKSMVHADWTSGKYASSNKASAPRLTVESVRPSSFLKSLFFKNRGHVFYAAE